MKLKIIKVRNHLFPNLCNEKERQDIVEMCAVHDEILEIGLPIGYWEESAGKDKINELYDRFYSSFYLNNKKIKISPKEFQQGDNIEKSKINELRFFIGDVIQNDRFIEGLFHSLVNDRIIERVLKRAIEIVKA